MPELTPLQRISADLNVYIALASSEGHTREQVSVKMLDFGAKAMRAAAVEIIEAIQPEFPVGSEHAILLDVIKTTLGMLPVPSAAGKFAELWK